MSDKNFFNKEISLTKSNPPVDKKDSEKTYKVGLIHSFNYMLPFQKDSIYSFLRNMSDKVVSPPHLQFLHPILSLLLIFVSYIIIFTLSRFIILHSVLHI